jgi:hypothetical protein
MTKQYTDEELSRILSAHEGECLMRSGCGNYDSRYGCVNQFAYNIFGQGAVLDAWTKNSKAALIFDKCYRDDMNPEELLLLLDKATEP